MKDESTVIFNFQEEEVQHCEDRPWREEAMFVLYMNICILYDVDYIFPLWTPFTVYNGGKYVDNWCFIIFICLIWKTFVIYFSYDIIIMLTYDFEPYQIKFGWPYFRTSHAYTHVTPAITEMADIGQIVWGNYVLFMW